MGSPGTSWTLRFDPLNGASPDSRPRLVSSAPARPSTSPHAPTVSSTSAVPTAAGRGVFRRRSPCRRLQRRVRLVARGGRDPRDSIHHEVDRNATRRGCARCAASSDRVWGGPLFAPGGAEPRLADREEHARRTRTVEGARVGVRAELWHVCQSAYFSCFHRNVYASASMNARCLLSAAPPCPPSTFS
jgi:hypothetical protein